MMEDKSFIKFGNYLKKIRSEKNLTLETVSDDIKISVRYLKALEDSNIEVFPNEVLAIGFLRTYSEYLDIDIRYISTLFKEYRNKLKDSYIGIKTDIRKPSNSSFLKSIYRCIVGTKTNYSILLKFLVGLLIVLFLFFLALNIKTISSYLKLSFKGSRNLSLSPAVYEIDFDKESFWNLTLKEGDSLSLIYDKNILRYKASFLKDKLIITDSLGDKKKFNIGESKEIDFNQNIKVRIIYDNYLHESVQANLTLESLILNLKYISDTNIKKRFNILNFKFNLNGPDLSSSDFPTVYSSNRLKPIKLNLKFLNNTFLRYADKDNLSGKSLFFLKDSFFNLNFEESLVLFFSRLSDVNVSIFDKDITGILKEFEKELVAYQFFWLKTPSGFEMKISEVY